MRVEVLGPLRLIVDGVNVDVPGPRRRAVLAMLTMAGGRVVSVDELIDAVWPDDAEAAATGDGGLASARRALLSHVSRLRAHLGPHAGVLEREGNGYRLRIDPDAIDANEVQALRTHARDVRDEQPKLAVELLGEALARWRGTALDEFPDVAPLAADAQRLASLRRDLVDEWLETRLDAGVDDDVVADAERALAAEPLRERTAISLVRALATAGRDVEAMRAANDFRRTLADETGLEPTAAFVSLEHEVAAGHFAGQITLATVAPRAATSPSVEERPARRTARRTRPSSPFVGRSTELASLHRDLASAALVTVVGPGGVGKTRLALEALADAGERDGRPTFLVELATVDEPRHVISALSAALQLSAPDPASVVESAAAVLGAGPALLALDNCEHLLDACRDLVDELLARVPGLTVLCTSREPLGLSAERVLRLGPLNVPTEAQWDDVAALVDLERVPAVKAFLAHVRRRSPQFELTAQNGSDVADIVRRLDGLPLALELAAGRVASLGARDVHRRLERALDLVGGARSGGDERHRTLRSTIEWSYRLLGEDERVLLRSMAVFPGGLDLDGIEWLAHRLGLDTDAAVATAHLVEASVLVVDGRGAVPRYRMLETVRAFGMDELRECDDLTQAEHALISWARTLVAQLDEQAVRGDERPAATRLAAELPNLRAAYVHAVASGDVEARADVVIHLADLGLYREYPELHAWSVELADHMRTSGHERAALVLASSARAAWLRGALDVATALANDALSLATEDDLAARSLAYDALGVVAMLSGDNQRSQELCAKAASLHHPQGDLSLATAALAAVYCGDPATAVELLERVQSSPFALVQTSRKAFARYVKGEMAAREGDLERAVEEYTVAVDLGRSVDATFMEGIAMVGLVSAWGRMGRVDDALDGYRWLIDYWRRAGNWPQLWTTLRNLAVSMADAGDHECATFVLAAADHADEASPVDDAIAPEYDSLRRRLAETLGADEFERIRRRAAALPRATVIEETLEAVGGARR